jgi:hypothetical protein
MSVVRASQPERKTKSANPKSTEQHADPSSQLWTRPPPNRWVPTR